jgi:hypothetical protein
MMELIKTLIEFIITQPVWSILIGWFIFSLLLTFYYISKEKILKKSPKGDKSKYNKTPFGKNNVNYN